MDQEAPQLDLICYDRWPGPDWEFDGTWADPTSDPMSDIMAMAEKMRTGGRAMGRTAETLTQLNEAMRKNQVAIISSFRVPGVRMAQPRHYSHVHYSHI